MFNNAAVQDIAIALAALAVITVPIFVNGFRSPRINRDE